jgi:hypothetical protein
MTAFFSPSRWLARIPSLPDLDPLAVLPALTVITLLLNAPEIWYLRIPLVALAIVGLALRGVLQSSTYWYALATLLGATVYFNWDTADNHQYLFVYWCLALCSMQTLPVEQRASAVAKTSRWLLALCMLLAVGWKLAMPDYRAVEFFEYTLAADPRFADLARAAGGESSIMLQDNRELIDWMTQGYLRGVEVNAVQLGVTPRVSSLAWLLTWWTVGIEAAIGILFLLPERRWTAHARNAVLVLFAITTYSVAHVRGFGWMLMLLGLAQCRPDEKAWRWAYFGAFLLIQLFLIPFVGIAEVFLDALGWDAGCGCLK